MLLPPRKKLHVKGQQALLALLAALARGRGFLTNEFPFRPAPEYEHRVARTSTTTFSALPTSFIEVLSESNNVDEMLERQQVCLANGCVSFWTVDPQRRTLTKTNPPPLDDSNLSTAA